VIDLLLQLYLALHYQESWNRVARAENQIKTKQNTKMVIERKREKALDDTTFRPMSDE
jgi:hypothetical protein